VTRLLPALTAAATDAVLVARPRGTVLHLATPGGAGLTATGRLRRGSTPLCGRRAPAWRTSAVDGRPLCHLCSRRATDRPVPAEREAELLAVTLASARDLPTVAACRARVVRSPLLARPVLDGRPLHEHVRRAQHRLAPPTPGRTERERRAARALPTSGARR
jgi:hypothetical protein